MFILGAQFDKHFGPDSIHLHKIGFTIDESQQDAMYKWLPTMKKGSSVLLMIFNVDEDEEEVKALAEEKTEDTVARLYKRMHAMINDIAKDKNKDSKEIKTALKDFLIKKNYIQQSTKELDVKGLAAAIYFLQNEF